MFAGSISANEGYLQKIEDYTQQDELHKINIKTTSQKDTQKAKLKPTTQLVVKPNPNIRYNKDMEGLSILNHDKESYKKIIKGIPKIVFKKIFGTTKSQESIKLTAYAYDWVYKRPDLADGYYELFPNSYHDIKMIDRLRRADFYLRTGQEDRIKELLSMSQCLANMSKLQAYCFYYLGIPKYIETGKSNNALRLAAQKIPKAKELLKKSF